MNDATIRRQRGAVQRSAQRRREALVLAASLICHAVLLLILPGFAPQVKPPPVIYVKLTQPLQALGAGPKATAPKYAPQPQGARVGPLNPDMKKGTAQPAPTAPGKPKPPSQTQAKGQAKPALAKPALAKPAAPAKVAPSAKPPSHIPMLPAKPQAKPDTPRVEQGRPAAPTKPAAKPQPPKPSEGGGSGGGDKRDTGGSAGSGGGAGGSGTPGGGSGGPPSDKEPGPGGKPGPPGAPDQGPAAPAGNPSGADKPPAGPPPPPPGPSQAELNLLEDYGAKAFKRIKSQARNSEQGVRGTVVFEFDVSRKGYLLDVRVVKSSGHNNLDQDVLEAARAAFNEKYEIIPFAKDISVDKWSFRKSIQYPLY